MRETLEYQIHYLVRQAEDMLTVQIILAFCMLGAVLLYVVHKASPNGYVEIPYLKRYRPKHTKKRR